MMERCIALAIQAVDVGEYPYAALICRDGEVVSEGINSARQDRDVTHHAEIVVMKQALRRLNQVSLEDCTIYTNAEPCALCSYAMRETRIGRVVFGVPAPLTGGLSRWNILADVELSNTLPEDLCAATGDRTRLHARTGRGSDGQADSNNLGFIRARNIFGGPLPAHLLEKLPVKRKENFRERLMSLLRRQLFDYLGRK